ncbi:MAG: carbon-nitrogen hydrolase family protein [Planctomycetota bacterium]
MCWKCLLLIISVLFAAVAAHGQGRKRIVTLSSLCLLNGERYENQDYVLGELAKCPEGADLLVLPHMPFLSFRADQAEADLKPFADFSQKRKTYMALSLTEKDADKIYFTAVLMDRQGKIIGAYRKTHAFPDDAIALGDDLPVFETDFGKVAMTITSDFYFPEIYQVLTMKGAEVLTWHHYPERMRDHSGWEPLLMARCLDSHAHMVTAMYADPRTYLTNRWELGMPGAAWGRSMVINRVGTTISDTGYADGFAMATVDLDKRKVDMGDGHYRGENIFFVNNYGDRTAFRPIAEPHQKPKLPAYAKRTCRLAVGTFTGQKMWRDKETPDLMLRLIAQAAELKPDLLLFSEQSCNIADETTRKTIEIVSAKAAAMKCYLAIAGVRDENHCSICRVWDRTGKEIYAEPIYWTKGFPELKVFDTDFGRIGAHTCGDLYIGEIDRVLALMGADIIIDGSMMWGASGRTNETMLRARAIDNDVWIACSHWLSSDPSLRSLIIDPYGQVMASSQFQKDGLIHVDINLEDQRVYYAGVKKDQPKRGEKGIPSYYSENMPDQRLGWREMVFEARRPELYGIIPTANDVILKYRGPKPPAD